MVLFQNCVCTAELNLTQDPMGNSHKNHPVWNQQLNQNQTWMEQSLDGPLPKLCPAVALSHQDGHHSAVALLLKAALIQERLQAPGSLWFKTYMMVKISTNQIAKKQTHLNLFRTSENLKRTCLPTHILHCLCSN